MKHTNLSWILCFALGILCACSPKQNESDVFEIEKIRFQLKEGEHLMNLSEIVDSIVYIPLETTDRSLLGEIDQVLLTESGEYLIADKVISSTLLLFAADGKFIRQIGTKGEGPKEYAAIEDVAYRQGKVYIWDSTGRKVLEYNLKGEVLNTYSVNCIAYSFTCIGEKEFAFFCEYTPNTMLSRNGTSPNLIGYDAKNETWTFDLFFDEAPSAQAYVMGLNSLSGHILCAPMNDTIYDVSSHEVKRKYVLDYPEVYKKNKRAYLAQFDPALAGTERIDEHTFPMWINRFETEQMDIYFIRVGDYLHYAFYYPESGTCIEASSSMGLPIFNDLDHTVPFLLQYAKGDVLYAVLPPEMLMEKNPMEAKKLGVKSDDNLLIVKMFVKR